MSSSDVSDGWRDRRVDSGVVVDVASGKIFATGLSLPHSQRLHGDKLWLLNSGESLFSCVDLSTGVFVPVCFCPGNVRELAFVGKYAAIGLPIACENRTFPGLGLDSALVAKESSARCGLLIVDIESGDIVKWVRIEGVVRERF